MEGQSVDNDVSVQRQWGNISHQQRQVWIHGLRRNKFYNEDNLIHRAPKLLVSQMAFSFELEILRMKSKVPLPALSKSPKELHRHRSQQHNFNHEWSEGGMLELSREKEKNNTNNSWKIKKIKDTQYLSKINRKITSKNQLQE